MHNTIIKARYKVLLPKGVTLKQLSKLLDKYNLSEITNIIKQICSNKITPLKWNNKEYKLKNIYCDFEYRDGFITHELDLNNDLYLSVYFEFESIEEEMTKEEIEVMFNIWWRENSKFIMFQLPAQLEIAIYDIFNIKIRLVFIRTDFFFDDHNYICSKQE